MLVSLGTSLESKYKDTLYSAQAAVTIPQTEWLKQQKCIFSQSWSLEIQDQGVIRIGVW